MGKNQEKKRLKEEPESENENEMETMETENTSFFDQLPPEMLMKILKYLNLKSLLASRLVSQKWNNIAREILRFCDDVETVFNCYRPNPSGKLRIVGTTTSLKFEHFLKCFDDSPEQTPLYTQFRFNCVVLPLFDNVHWLKFISDYGKSIKRLKLVINSYFDDDEDDDEEIGNNDNDLDLTKLAEKLRNLILNQLPNLQELGLKFKIPETLKESGSVIKLFSSTKAKTTVQLPHLKVLYLDESSLSEQTEIIMDLLQAAVNLQKIELFEPSDCFESIDSFDLLQYCEKIHCVQDGKIEPINEFFSTADDIFGAPFLKFKLKNLKLQTSSVLNDGNVWYEASGFLSNLFESSKNTLRDLKTNSMGFLPNLRLPKFSTLTSLYLYGGCDQNLQALPTGIKLMEIFPVLQHLDLDFGWTEAFPQIGYEFSIPSLKSLQLVYIGMSGTTITQIAAFCPNLKILKIIGSLYNFPEVGTAIWTHMERLQSLDLEISAECLANSFPAVDSCITGFSREDCLRLYDLIEKQEPQIKIPQSELKAERKNASILDLKDLKNLTIRLVWFNTKTEEHFGKPLIISEKCVFELLDNLDYRKEKSYIHRS